MSTVIFETEEAIFQFDRKSVMECLKNRKTSYQINELDTIIDVLSSKPKKVILSFEKHQYFGFIALNLINSKEGSVLCMPCSKNYRSNQLRAFTEEPDDALRAASAKKKGLKNPFRKRPKHFPMYGGKGYRCPRGHMLIYMQTWTT